MRKRYGPTEMELAFIEHYTDHGDQTLAAKQAGYSEHTAQVQASQLKKKLSKEIDSRLTEKMAGDCALARSVIVKLARESQSEDIRLKAAKDIMDRGGHPASKEIISKKDESNVQDKIERLKELMGDKANDLIKDLTPEETDNAIH